MTPLELKKIKVELMRVQAAKGDLEIKVEERLEEIKRIQDSIKAQEIREAELIEKIKVEEGK